MTLDTSSYILESDVYIRPDYPSLNYSDGDSTEQEMHSLLQKANDLSTNSDEFATHINNWAFEYHFSKLRHNLLRSFQLKQFQNVLEFGSGAGAISRQLAESCGQLTTVEGSLQRALITAERCRDLDNVCHVCDNFENIEIQQPFDLITMIGTVEYAVKYIQGDTPVQTILEKALQGLTKDGILLIAIENKLGLKYFNGCGEDHEGNTYFGINDLYHKETAFTLGYHELKQQIQDVGFTEIEFLFPFPDYKLPQLIVRETALNHPHLNLGEIIGQFQARDYQGREVRQFSERLCWDVIGKNYSIPSFSNSFLVIASRQSPERIYNGDWLLKTYNLNRKPDYQTETAFVPDDKNGCVVTKRYIHPDQAHESAFLKHQLTQEAYVSGSQVGSLVVKGLLNETWYKQYLKFLKKWIDYLRQFTLPNPPDHELSDHWKKLGFEKLEWLPGNFMDCIPRNLIYRENQLTYIDQEWSIKTSIPLLWVVYRGILTDIGDQQVVALISPIFKKYTNQHWVEETMENLNMLEEIITLNREKLFHELVIQEIRFRSEVTGQSIDILTQALNSLLQKEIGTYSDFNEYIYETRHALEEKEQTIQKLREIISSQEEQKSEFRFKKLFRQLQDQFNALQIYFPRFVNKKLTAIHDVKDRSPHYICMIVPSFDRIGGYERQAFSMCLAYKKIGKHPYIVTQNFKHLPTYEVRQGIEIYRFNTFFSRVTPNFTLGLRKLFVFDLVGKIDIVHCHAFDFMSGWAIRLASQYGIPSLVKIATEQDVLKFKEQMDKKIKGFTEAFNNLKKASYIVSLNPNIKKELIISGVEESKILNFPNGVDCFRFKPLTVEKKKQLKKQLKLDKYPYLITYTGRFEERKRTVDLIDAWWKIEGQFPSHHLLLIGKGEELPMCLNKVKSLGLLDRVSFIGEVTNVEEYLQITDCYVFPSRLEGMPNVVLEAMACGLPIVTTAIPGINEIIQDGVHGKLVPPMEITILAQTVTWMLNHPKEAQKLGENARKETLEKYSFKMLEQRYFNLYNKLLQTKA